MLLQHPERRWWLEAPRKRMKLPVAINWREIKLSSETFDISETGAFISLDGKEDWPEFQSDQSLAICMSIGTLQQFRCHGRVVRRVDAKGRLPGGHRYPVHRSRFPATSSAEAPGRRLRS